MSRKAPVFQPETAETHSRNPNELAKKLLAITLALGAVGYTAACDNAEATPVPTETVTVTAEPTETETTPTVEPSSSETENPGTGEVNLTEPIVVDGPFGNEYAPLHSDSMLEATLSMERMKAMDWEEFAEQPIQDRLNYLYTAMDGDDRYDRPAYFSVEENIRPVFITDGWSTIDAFAVFGSDDPEECAKYAISNKMFTIDINGVTDTTRQIAEGWKRLCEAKDDYSSWAESLALTDEVSMREMRDVAGFNEPLPVSVLKYDRIFSNGSSSDIMENKTIDAYELTIRRPDGSIVVGFARGFTS